MTKMRWETVPTTAICS